MFLAFDYVMAACAMGKQCMGEEPAEVSAIGGEDAAAV